MATKQMYKMRMPNGKIYQFRGTLEAAQQRAKEKGFTPVGFELATTAVPAPTAPTQPNLVEVDGTPRSSNEYDQWISQGYVFRGGKWYKPSQTTTPTQQPEAPVSQAPTTPTTPQFGQIPTDQLGQVYQPQQPQTGAYTIQSGDTLSQLAQQHGTTVEALMAANPQITNPNLIHAGASLNIPQAGQAPTAPTTPTPEAPSAPAPPTPPTDPNIPITPETIPPTDPANIIDEAGELIIPQELQDDPYFTQLDPDMQAMAIYSWNITQAGQAASEAETKAYQDAFLEAIDLATEQANPYWAEQLRMIKDEFQRTIGTLSDDLASVEQTIATHQAQIQEDLEYNTDQLTVEQQAELARRGKEYKIQLDSTREQLAQRGLSSSSIRNEAEERLRETQSDIVESTERKYARQLRNLTTGAGRGLEGLVTQLEESRRKTGEAKTRATRGAEKQIGSDLLDLPETEQYELGGIYGAPWQQAQQQDIFTRAKDILAMEFPSL